MSSTHFFADLSERDPRVVYCDVCPKPARKTFTRPDGSQLHRCGRHSKPLIALQNHGRMAVPRGRR